MSIADVNAKWDSLEDKLDSMDVDRANVAATTKDLSWMSKQKYYLYPEPEALAILKEMKAYDGLIAADIETTGFDWISDRIVGMSLCMREGESIYIPFDRLRDPRNLLEIFASKQLVFHNGKFDLKFLQKVHSGIKMTWDTMILAYYCNMDQRVNLDALSKKYLGLDSQTFTELTKPYGGNMSNVPFELQMLYGCADSDQTMRLMNKFKDIPKRYPMVKVTMALSQVLMEAEIHGILMDPELLVRGQEKVISAMQQLEEEIYATAGKRFVITSPAEVAEVLYEFLKLPVLKRSAKTKKASTDKLTLKQLSSSHPIVAKISRYKSLVKGEGSYLKTLHKHIDSRDGAIHSSFLLAHVPTNRLSMENPSLHNIPKNIEDLVNVRDAFVARPGYYLVEADQCQVEFRLLCYIANITKMVEAFESGKDPHRTVSGWMFGVQPDQVTDDQRGKGKTLNFGICYGMGEYGLSARLGCSSEVARGLLAKYYKAMEPLNEWKKEVIKEARKCGYVTLLYGTRRWIPYIQLKPDGTKETKKLIAHAERGVVNTLIQGGAAEIQRIAMVRVVNEIKRRGLDAHFCLTVHDSIILEVNNDIPVAEICEVLRKGMEFPIVKYNRPIPVDIKVGQRFGSLKVIKEQSVEYKLIEIEVDSMSKMQLEQFKGVLGTEGVEVVLSVDGRRFELAKQTVKCKVSMNDIPTVKGILPGVRISGVRNE